MDITASDLQHQSFSSSGKWNIMNLIPGLAEVLSIVFAFQCSWYISFPGNAGLFLSDPDLLKLFLCIFPFWILVLYLIKVTRIQTNRFKILLFLYLHFAFSIIVLLIIFNFILRSVLIPRLFFIEVTLIGFLFLFFVRLLEYKIFKSKRSNRHFHNNVVLIADDTSIPFIDDLLTANKAGSRIVAIFTESPKARSRYENIAYVLTEKYIGILNDLIEVDLIDEVLYLKEKKDPGEIRTIIKSCEDLGITFKLRDNENQTVLSSAIRTKTPFGNFLSFINMPFNSYSMAIRKILDVNISLLLISALLPVFIIIGILIKLSSRGPLFCKELIAGIRGRQFYRYKFRTISEKACPDNIDLESSTPAGGRRSYITENYGITKIGRFLVNSGLDQLPLLINVAKGEVTILGFRGVLQSGYSQQNDSKN
jgi:lipopolysaccharide/colanic/teichoic acid biosynthesis glycosyltransferase